MSISKNIIKYREKKGWSQQKLAKEAGISQASIHYWEKGDRIPKSKSIAKIAEALNVNYKDIDDEGESYITFRPPNTKINFPNLFAGISDNWNKDSEIANFLPEYFDAYQNIVFDWADSRGYEYVDHNERISILKDGHSIYFDETDIDALQNFIENYLDVQLERKIKALKN